MQWTLVTPMRTPPRGGGGGSTADSSCSASGGRNASTTPIAAGTYLARLVVGGRTYTTPITVLEDVWMHER